jgi:peptide chain release factor 1
VWASLKYEGGVHRVQRIPVTDTQGRIQTSAAGVYVFPEIDDDSNGLTIDPKDLRIDTFQASGPGGQGVNTTYSAVRITHLPTGIVVSMQDQRSQIQNRAAGMRVLRSRLFALKREQEEQKAADARHSQVRNLDRSQRIRTYNFPENRIVDHRTGYKAYNLDQVLAGDLSAVIDSDIQADEAERLAQAANAR